MKAAFLVGYFCYQVVYGIETTLWPNGTRTFGDLPPGSTITNITGNAYNGSATIHVGPPPLDLTNTTWTIYNATSGSIGTITFKAYTVETGDKKGLTTNPPPTVCGSCKPPSENMRVLFYGQNADSRQLTSVFEVWLSLSVYGSFMLC